MKTALYAGKVSIPLFQESATELTPLCDSCRIQHSTYVVDKMNFDLSSHLRLGIPSDHL